MNISYQNSTQMYHLMSLWNYFCSSQKIQRAQKMGNFEMCGSVTTTAAAKIQLVNGNFIMFYGKEMIPGKNVRLNIICIQTLGCPSKYHFWKFGAETRPICETGPNKPACKRWAPTHSWKICRKSCFGLMLFERQTEAKSINNEHNEKNLMKNVSF